MEKSDRALKRIKIALKARLEKAKDTIQNVGRRGPGASDAHPLQDPRRGHCRARGHLAALVRGDVPVAGEDGGGRWGPLGMDLSRGQKGGSG